MPAQLLLGGADGRLIDVSDRAGAPWRVPRMGRGLAVGDLDNDGRQDVLILSHNQPLAYFHNRTDGGRSLTLRLEGAAPIATPSAPASRSSPAAGASWPGASGGAATSRRRDPRLHFGLGARPAPNPSRSPGPRAAWIATRAWRPGAGYLLREGQGRPEPLEGFLSRRRRPQP